MSTLADNGFGDLVPTKNPFGYVTKVYTRLNGGIARFDAETSDPHEAVNEVRRELRMWARGTAVLAVIDGGQQ